jgi:asparagine synthase (glutamine-hydrolysing)
MVSACGRYQIVLNGEIYNHRELREQLPETPWRGHSDTETLLACISQWGIERALARLVGMFAFGVFDRQSQRLLLARDRFGEKPLYYGYSGGDLLFASELRALRESPRFDSTVDRISLSEYMRYGCVPEPRSIYASIRKLPAGSWVEIAADHIGRRSLPEPRPYWSAIQKAVDGAAAALKIDETEAVLELERLLGSAVRGQMLADVPLGAFLSGGVDSSLIVSLMQAQSSRPVRTFSIGFWDRVYDESEYARRVAAYLGTEHVTLRVSADDALGTIPELPSVYDEPFADSSQLPMLLVARLARRQVKVALSGDAGDEMFGGYHHYLLAARIGLLMSTLPVSARRSFAKIIRSISPASLNGLRFLGLRLVGDRMHKAADVLECNDLDDVYARLTTHWWKQPVVVGGECGDRATQARGSASLGNLHKMMLFDTTNYLPNDILVKVDRAAMSVGLETRIPMLDHRIFEFAWRLPERWKIRGRDTKWILKRILHRHLPKGLVDRPKMGFAVPLASWLRGPLREWAESLLDEHSMRDDGYLDAAEVSRRWNEHISGIRNWHYEIWNVLMFQAWLRKRERTLRADSADYPRPNRALVES